MGSSANDVADYLADIAYLKKTIRDDPSKHDLAKAKPPKNTLRFHLKQKGN